MARFALDTNVLIRQPEILGTAASDISFLVPRQVLRELERRVERPILKRLMALVDEGVKQGHLTIVEGGPEQSGDEALIKLMVQPEWGPDLVLVTNDRPLLVTARERGLKAIDGATLAAQLESLPTKDRSVLKKARSLVRLQWVDFVLKVSLGVFLSAIANILPSKLNRIVATVNVWGTLALLILTAIALYWLRGRYRLAYGFAEFGIGFSAAARVFWPQFKYTLLRATDALQMIAGLYVMIRGLDNIGKGLKGTRWEATWARFSGE